jgi:hypothetical protein
MKVGDICSGMEGVGYITNRQYEIMEECCICHEAEATSPDGFFCDECAKHYQAVLVSTIVLSEKTELLHE